MRLPARITAQAHHMSASWGAMTDMTPAPTTAMAVWAEGIEYDDGWCANVRTSGRTRRTSSFTAVLTNRVPTTQAAATSATSGPSSHVATTANTTIQPMP